MGNDISRAAFYRANPLIKELRSWRSKGAITYVEMRQLQNMALAGDDISGAYVQLDKILKERGYRTVGREEENGMVILNRKEQNYIMDLLAAIRVTLCDMGDDPSGTASFIDGKIARLIPMLGGKKGVERATERMEAWLKKDHLDDEKCDACDTFEN